MCFGNDYRECRYASTYRVEGRRLREINAVLQKQLDETQEELRILKKRVALAGDLTLQNLKKVDEGLSALMREVKK